MQVTTILLAAITGMASLSSATPLAKRECQVQYPASIGFPINYNVSDTRKDAVNFQMPPGAQGCNLAVIFPQGYAGISHNGPTDTVNFRDSAGNIVGSQVPIRSSPDQQTHISVNTFVCQDLMSYTMEYPITDIPDGWVAFSEIKDAGVVMEYSCAVSAY